MAGFGTFVGGGVSRGDHRREMVNSRVSASSSSFSHSRNRGQPRRPSRYISIYVVLLLASAGVLFLFSQRKIAEVDRNDQSKNWYQVVSLYPRICRCPCPTMLSLNLSVLWFLLFLLFLNFRHCCLEPADATIPLGCGIWSLYVDFFPLFIDPLVLKTYHNSFENVIIILISGHLTSLTDMAPDPLQDGMFVFCY